MKKVIITGIPRSGIGLVAEIISMCELTYVNQKKVKGISNYEIPIVTKINEGILRQFGADPKMQSTLLDTSALPYNSYIKPTAKMIAEKLQKSFAHIPDYKLIVIPSSTFLPLHSLYRLIFPKSKWILVRRDKSEVIQSCLKTGYMNAFATEEEWDCWYENFKAYEKQVVNQGCLIIRLKPETLRKSIKEIVDFLGVDANINHIHEVISQKL